MRDYLKMIECGAAEEEIVRALRDDGFSKVQSMIALCDLRLANLEDAKRLVHLSKTWADRRAADDAFHDELMESLSAPESDRALDK